MAAKAFFERCEKLLDFAPPEEVDAYARKQMKSAVREYDNVKREPLSHISFKVNGNTYESIQEALFFEEELKELELSFDKTVIKKFWDYDTPTKKIKINEKGRGGLMIYIIDPYGKQRTWSPLDDPTIEMAMFRASISRYYVAESIKTHSNRTEDEPLPAPPILTNPKEQWKAVRQMGFVPFELRLCAYTKHARYAFNIDLLRNVQIKNFRDGKITPDGRVRRPPLQLLYLDKILSHPELPDMQKSILEAVFDSNGMSPSDVAHAYGLNNNTARNFLKGLVSRGFLESEGKEPGERYKASIEQIVEEKGTVKSDF